MTQIITRQIPYSHNHDQYSLTNYQKYSSHDSFKYVIPSQEQAYDQVKYTQIASDESNAFNHYLDLEGQYLPEVLFNESLERYSPQQMSIIPYNDFSNIERIDIQHILNPIQQDYFHTVQPYASSVTFKNNYEDDHLLVDNESMTVAPIQTDYTRQSENIYHQHAPSRQYINTNDFNSYEKMHSQNSSTNHQYSSANRRRKHRKRYRAQVSSPIHVSKSFNTMDTQSQIESK
ncbi:unnamed protein product [Rotaria sordida]|uniref:Uncharacterized protein n=2 Tax=Rotaria sordida TaxID=392033 RepID=A0A819AN01_9BILA|nr:unnamed protein product [Rotaria sordida]